MKDLDRIVIDPRIMAGKPCVKDTRVTVGTIVGLYASGHDLARVLELYPYLTENDVHQALRYQPSDIKHHPASPPTTA